MIVSISIREFLVQVSKSMATARLSLNSLEQQQLKIFSVSAVVAAAAASSSFCNDVDVDVCDDICTHIQRCALCDKYYWICAQFCIAPYAKHFVWFCDTVRENTTYGNETNGLTSKQQQQNEEQKQKEHNNNNNKHTQMKNTINKKSKKYIYQ